MAKCIQDGRRVDLPLSLPFFKLMCTPWEKGVSRNASTVGVEEEKAVTPTSVGEEGNQVTPPLSSQKFDVNLETFNDEDRDCVSNSLSTIATGPSRGSNSDLILDSVGVSSVNEASHHGEAGAKEAELVLSNHLTEISKDGSPKDDVTFEQVEGEGSRDKGWFEDILNRSDLLEVNPHQGLFLKHVDILVKERDAILSREGLSVLEKEQAIAGLTLPGAEENIPGASIENLWYVSWWQYIEVILLY